MTIYDRIGGAPAVGAAVDLFYGKVLADPALSGYFAGADMAHLKAHQRAFIAAAVGGPEVYKGRSIGAAHAGLDIGEDEFEAVVGHLVATLTELGVPSEIIGQIGDRLDPLETEIVAPKERTGQVTRGR